MPSGIVNDVWLLDSSMAAFICIGDGY
jgi:hypothetical protein